MSSERLPEAVPLDPGSDSLPPELDLLHGDGIPPLLLLLAPDTGDASLRAAIALAEARSMAGHTTVLADASARDPRLHSLLDVPNAEGMTDVLLYGVSTDRVRTRPPARPFEFIPVGAYFPDEPEVLDTHRWDGIAAAFQREEATLLLFVPAGTPGLEGLSRRFGQAILIGDPGSVDRMAGRLDPSCDVLAVVAPTDSVEPAALAAMAGAATDAETETIFDRPGGDEEVFAEEPKPRRRVSPILWVLLVVTLAVAGWVLYTDYLAPARSTDSAAQPAAPAVTPGSTAPATPADSSAPEPATGGDSVGDTAAAVDAAPDGEPVSPAIPVSVAVEAHSDYATAAERAESLQVAAPGIRFYLAPVDVDGATYYRLLAGPAVDREAGGTLMAELVDAGHKTANDTWAIRMTPYAFALGEFGTADAARARVDSLQALQIPSYVVPIRYASGPQRFRVYAGAFETEAEAELLRAQLAGAGVEAELVTRTGQPVSGS